MAKHETSMLEEIGQKFEIWLWLISSLGCVCERLETCRAPIKHHYCSQFKLAKINCANFHLEVFQNEKNSLLQPN